MVEQPKHNMLTLRHVTVRDTYVPPGEYSGMAASAVAGWLPLATDATRTSNSGSNNFATNNTSINTSTSRGGGGSVQGDGAGPNEGRAERALVTTAADGAAEKTKATVQHAQSVNVDAAEEVHELLRDALAAAGPEAVKRALLALAVGQGVH